MNRRLGGHHRCVAMSTVRSQVCNRVEVDACTPSLGTWGLACTCCVKMREDRGVEPAWGPTLIIPVANGARLEDRATACEVLGWLAWWAWWVGRCTPHFP